MSLAAWSDDYLQAGAALEGLDLGETAAGGGMDEDRNRSFVLC
ncbi:hypothetical protein [Pseudomonas sichuanensis]